MSKILVAGGAGFLGSHLIEALLEKGESLVCVDNLLTGRLSNIKSFKNKPNFTFIEHDITQPLELNDKFDYIINLACPASPVDYRKHPVETLMANSRGVKNLLDLALRNKARFIQTSTSEVYGDPSVHPQKESYWGNVNCYGERACYDEGKRFAEALIYIYRKDFGLDTGIIRIFNTYGPRMQPNDGRVVSNFIRQALAGEDITIYGDGKQTRSFCYVSDQIRGQIKMLYSGEEGPINIGNPAEFTMLELAKKVIKLTGSQSKIIHKPLPADDPKQRCPDIKLAKSKLNWRPEVGLDEGLERTTKWFKNQKS